MVPKNVEKVNTLVRIKTEIAEQSEYEVNAIHSEVDKQTKHILFFNNVAFQNVRESIATKCKTQRDFKDRADTRLQSWSYSEAG